MTDNEITKALEEMGAESKVNFSNKVLDLINQQKSEIEKLKEENDALKQQTHFAYEVEIPQYRALSKIATKEFAEKLKIEIHSALENNYRVRAERLKRPIVDTADEFIGCCDGKIHALRGIDDFIDDLLRKEDEGNG